MKKVLLLDVDGVVADFHKPTLEFIAREFGVHHDPETFSAWDIIETVGRQHQEAIETEWAKQGWCDAIPAYPGAVEAVRELMQVADVYFVTAQMTHAPHWMWERAEWLRQRFDVDARRVVFTLSKHLVVGDILVDDKPANVEAWRAHHPERTTVLWEASWNRGWQEPEGVIRVRGWGDLRRLVDGGVQGQRERA